MAQDFRTVADAAIDARTDHFWEVAQGMFDNPQVHFEETYAAGVSREELAAAGLEVSLPCDRLPTSFEGTFSTGDGPTVAILCEYDALPKIGHACGHPIICTSGLLAGIACREAMEACGIKGTVRVIGTPAEEDGAGKQIMLEDGCFEGCDAALLSHPTTKMTRVAGGCCSSMWARATFTGRPAQSQSHPDQGVNALDAVALCQTALGVARQQLPDDVHVGTGVVECPYDGISIPDHAVFEFHVSSTGGNGHLMRGMDVCRRVAEGMALATGCELAYEVQQDAFYLGRLANETIGAVMREETRAIGEPCQDGLPIDQGGEDFGNVTRVVPGVQIFGSLLLERKVSGHSEEFLGLARSEAGRHCMVVCAKAMARTALALMDDPALVEAAKDEMRERLAQEEE